MLNASSDVDLCKDVGLRIPTLWLWLNDDEGATKAIVVSTMMIRRDSSTIQFIPPPQLTTAKIFEKYFCKKDTVVKLAIILIAM